jgi:hypothetical protein
MKLRFTSRFPALGHSTRTFRALLSFQAGYHHPVGHSGRLQWYRHIPRFLSREAYS